MAFYKINIKRNKEGVVKSLHCILALAYAVCAGFLGYGMLFLGYPNSYSVAYYSSFVMVFFGMVLNSYSFWKRLNFERSVANDSR